VSRKKTTLEEEAKQYTQRRRTQPKKSAKPLTSRRYLAGCALSGLLARSPHGRPDELVIEAYRLADLMLDYD